MVFVQKEVIENEIHSQILFKIIKLKEATSTEIAKELKKSRTHVSERLRGKTTKGEKETNQKLTVSTYIKVRNNRHYSANYEEIFKEYLYFIERNLVQVNKILSDCHKQFKKEELTYRQEGTDIRLGSGHFPKEESFVYFFLQGMSIKVYAFKKESYPELSNYKIDSKVFKHPEEHFINSLNRRKKLKLSEEFKSSKLIKRFFLIGLELSADISLHRTLKECFKFITENLSSNQSIASNEDIESIVLLYYYLHSGEEEFSEEIHSLYLENQDPN